MNKVVSISIKHGDTTTLAAVAALKAHCRKTGKSFSHIVCKAIVASEEVQRCLTKK